VVECLADNPKIKGSNPVAGPGRDKMAKISLASSGGIVVEH
jgi:hypothetical protein